MRTQQVFRRLLWLLAVVLAGTAPLSCVVGKPSGLAGTGAGNGTDSGLGAADDGGTLTGCASAVCAPLECGPEMRALPLPGECCPTLCEPLDCSTVDCPPLDCASGTHAEKPNGLCCAGCVANPKASAGATCDQGQAGYATYLDQTMSDLGAALCETDSNCRIVVIDNPCSHGCGTAVAFRTATELETRLQSYAATHCGACEQTTPGCPPVEQFAYCTGGVCSAH